MDVKNVLTLAFLAYYETQFEIVLIDYDFIFTNYVQIKEQILPVYFHNDMSI